MADSTPPRDPKNTRKSMPPWAGLLIVGACLAASALILVTKYGSSWGSDDTDDTDAGDSSVLEDRMDPNGYTGWNAQLAVLDEQFDLSNLQIDRDLIGDPGPDIDSIPTLTTAAARPSDDPFSGQRKRRGSTAPQIVEAANADFMLDNMEVIGVTIGEQSRAYPMSVLDRHECVNDVLDGVPIAVTYCPLCDSVTVFDRRVGEGDQQQTLEFGVSGVLYNSNVLLYDRTDMALWSQVYLKAVSGPRAGQPLRYLGGWSKTRYGDWRQAHPQTTVLSHETGAYSSMSYMERGYQGYFTTDELLPGLTLEHEDDRLPRKTPVIGVVFGDITRAYLISAIDGELIDPMTTPGTTPTPGTSPGISPGVSSGTAPHTPLVLRSDGDGRIDIVSIPEGALVTHTFWYAWYAFHPETELVGLEN